MSYIDLKLVPNEDDYVLTEYVVDSDLSLTEAGKRIAEEESVGSWTEVGTMTSSVFDRLAARVYRVDEQTDTVHIAYPVELFERQNLYQWISVVAGNLFGLSSLRNVRLANMSVPEQLLRSFGGPKFGIEGVREKIGTKKDRRPHIGCIFKPKVGLAPAEMADLAYQVGKEGVDFLKDDETLTDQTFCPLEDRASLVSEALDRVYQETQRRVMYATNITAGPSDFMTRADVAIENGASALMVDAMVCGIENVRVLAEDPSVDVPVHVHRTMHAAFTRNPKHGISFSVIALLTRIAGGDQLHVGTAGIGKMESEEPEVRRSIDLLTGKLSSLRTVFPVASGGIHPGLVPALVKAMGNDVVINSGAGIWGHPDGGAAGARAMKEAVEATIQGIPLRQYSEKHQALKRALDRWMS
ncbi:MAG TPA: RuBisCO large subunit C-terminal-like domain-containing protein [Thermoproteota archaeon]|nr:RuBisCO large subunit C-terminal-like domain-containing protein [Thermoproteota archaeon]